MYYIGVYVIHKIADFARNTWVPTEYISWYVIREYPRITCANSVPYSMRNSHKSLVYLVQNADILGLLCRSRTLQANAAARLAGTCTMTYQFLTFGISALWTCILTYQPGFWHISGRLAYQPGFWHISQDFGISPGRPSDIFIPKPSCGSGALAWGF